LLDCTVHRGKTETGALPDFLGGEERLENMGHHLPAHPTAVVAHRKPDIFAGQKAGMDGAILLVEGAVGRFHRDHPDAGNGAPGIDTEIGEKLIDLGRIHLDRPQPAAGFPGQFDVFAEEPPEHLENCPHHLVEIDHLRHDRLLAGKGQQLAGNVGRPLGGGVDLFQIALDRLIPIHRFHGQLGVAEDHPEHIVEIVGYASRQLTDRFHFLGLLQLGLEPGIFLLGPLAFGDILDHRNKIFRQVARCSTNHRDGEIDPDYRAVLSDIPFFHAVGIDFAGQDAADVGHIEFEVVGMGDILEGLLQQFLPAVADDVAQLLVDSQPASIRRHMGDANRRLLESGPESLFIFLQFAERQDTAESVGQPPADLVEKALLFVAPNPRTGTLMHAERPGLAHARENGNKHLGADAEHLGGHHRPVGPFDVNHRSLRGQGLPQIFRFGIGQRHIHVQYLRPGIFRPGDLNRHPEGRGIGIAGVEEPGPVAVEDRKHRLDHLPQHLLRVRFQLHGPIDFRKVLQKCQMRPALFLRLFGVGDIVDEDKEEALRSLNKLGTDLDIDQPVFPAAQPGLKTGAAFGHRLADPVCHLPGGIDRFEIAKAKTHDLFLTVVKHPAQGVVGVENAPRQVADKKSVENRSGKSFIFLLLAAAQGINQLQ